MNKVRNDYDFQPIREKSTPTGPSYSQNYYKNNEEQNVSQKPEPKKNFNLFQSNIFALLFVCLILCKVLNLVTISWWGVFFLPLGASIFWLAFSTISVMLWGLIFVTFQTLFTPKHKYF